MSGRGKDDAPQTPNLPLSARALLSRQRNAGVMSGPGRLPSLRPARDLSLGATPKLNLAGKLTKRPTFTPTIPARRIKEEPKDQDSTSKDVSSQKNRRDQNQGGEGHGRGRGRGRGNRGKPEIVKSQSVFSMGPAEKGKTGHSAPSVSFSGGDRRESKNTKAVIKKEKNLECDTDESKRILQMLQTEDDDAEDECTEFGMAPVSIPLSSFSLKIKDSVEDSRNQPIKEEPMDVDMDDFDQVKKPIKPKPVIPKVLTKAEEIQPTCEKLFNITSESNEDKFVFIQLPDKLPIKPTKPGAKSASEGETTDEQSEKTKGMENRNLSLKDVSEGYIGKLQVLKSGKTRLVLGDVTLDVAMGTSCSFLQELVTVHTGEDRRDMTVLGQVKHRIICTPDFEQLLTAQ